MPPPPKNLVLHDYARYFFMLVILGVLLLFFWIISPFFNVLIYATLITVVFYPLQTFFIRLVRGHRGISAFLSTLLVLILVLTPLTLFILFLARQAVSAFSVLDSRLLEIDFDRLESNLPLSDLPWVGEFFQSFLQRYGFGAYDVDLFQVIEDLGQRVSDFLVLQGGSVLLSIGDTVVSIFILLLTIFFFFRDGEQLTAFMKKLSPLPSKYENEIENKLRETTYAIVVGNFGTAFLQGLVGAVGMAIAGVENVIFWGTLMAFASLIPYVGSSLIWGPAALALILNGSLFWGIFLIVWGLTLVSVVDNIARPYLIGSRTKMHPLATFLAVLGGIFVFGLKGILFGPLILSVTVTVVHIYQLEYRHVLRS